MSASSVLSTPTARIWTAEEQAAHDNTVLFQFWPRATDTFTCADGTTITHNFFRFMGPRLMPCGLPMDLYPPCPGDSVWRTAESLGFDNDYALAYHALLEERQMAEERFRADWPWIDPNHPQSLMDLIDDPDGRIPQFIRESYGLPRLNALITRAEETMRRHMATWYRRRAALSCFRS